VAEPTVMIDPIGDLFAWVAANWIILLATFVIANVFFSFLKAMKPKEEVVRTRPVYVSRGGKTETMEAPMDTIKAQPGVLGDGSMAKKKLIPAWQCDQCEEYYETEKEAEEDECTDKTITKFYQCDACDEYYDNPFRAQRDDECDGKFSINGETLHMIDGKLQRGHMKCLSCGWEGDVNDTTNSHLSNTKVMTSDAGELVYTSGATEADDSVLILCPECGTEELVFVPKTKPTV
jgi:DNA-directed RNA polymerase subunit M/transcription elongation factor TFIIS